MRKQVTQCKRCGYITTPTGIYAHRKACERLPLPAELAAELEATGMSASALAEKYSYRHDGMADRLALVGAVIHDDVSRCESCEALLYDGESCGPCEAEAKRQEARRKRERELDVWRERQRQLRHERGALQRAGVRRNYA